MFKSKYVNHLKFQTFMQAIFVEYNEGENQELYI